LGAVIHAAWFWGWAMWMVVDGGGNEEIKEQCTRIIIIIIIPLDMVKYK
jgi:hypothetical protein